MSPIPHTLMARTIEIIPHLRPAPFTTNLLTLNLVCRVVFAVVSNLVCLVPLKNLCRNGEFAAVVFVTTVIILNTDTIVNSLIWPDDNIEEWWRGWVWCDVHPYIYQPLLTVYGTSVIAIMRNLAEQVNLMRVGPLTVVEKRNRTWSQALIIFPLPVIQLGWVYPLSGQRYTIGTLKGCLWTTTPNWVCIVFFLLPIPIISLMAGFYSILTWKRYTQIERSTRSAIMSNSSATARSNRTRRRLFFMTTCILLPYVPVTCINAVLQMKAYYPWQEFDFGNIHHASNPFAWDSIILYTHDQLSFFELNSNYLPILTAIAIFLFFGLTQDTKDTYRHCLLAVRLDKTFPRLRNDIDSGGDLPANSSGSQLGTTPAKLDDEGFGRAVHITQASKTPRSLSSPPPAYSADISSITHETNLHLINDDLAITVTEPEPCACTTCSCDETVAALSKKYFLHERLAPKTPPCSSRSGFGTHGFSGKQIMIAPTANSRRVYTQIGSDRKKEANHRTRDAWLPQLCPQPELIEMIPAQMTRSGNHSRAPLA